LSKFEISTFDMWMLLVVFSSIKQRFMCVQVIL